MNYNPLDPWSLVNRADAEAQFEHYVYIAPEHQNVALADHSVRDPLDPSSADDGLLVWDGRPGIWSRGLSGAMNIRIMVIDQDRNLEPVTITVETAQTMESVSVPDFIRFGPYKYIREQLDDPAQPTRELRE